MRKASDSSAEAGFSLVEVLCALAIAAGATMALMNGLSVSLKGAGSVERHLEARVLLRSILDDALASEDVLPTHQEGRSGLYRWQLESTPASFRDASGPPAPFRIYALRATVSWEEGGRLSQDTLRLAR